MWGTSGVAFIVTHVLDVFHEISESTEDHGLVTSSLSTAHWTGPRHGLRTGVPCVDTFLAAEYVLAALSHYHWWPDRYCMTNLGFEGIP